MKKSLLYSATLALMVVGTAQGALLNDLLGGASLTAGDKVFDQWKIIFQGTSTGVLIDPDGIDVTALNDGGDDPGPGITIDFGDEMTVVGDGDYAYSDLTISFRVSPAGDKQIKDNSLTLSDDPVSVLSWLANGSNDLGIFIEEWVYADAALGIELGHTSIEFSVLDDVQTLDLSGSTAFAPQDEIWVVKNFLVWSVDDSDTASLGGVEQRFSQQVPEPATLLLFALGLAGAGFASRRRD